MGMRTKGNSSLSQVIQMEDSDRYSFHFKFNKYQKGQTYYGLDSFCINNLIDDNTYMKDYLSYHIMNFIGVPTPLMNYARVCVNGEDLGFYIALERYEKSFLDRVYDSSGGQLYNVKVQMGQEGGNPPEGNNRQNGGSLVYTDDNISSYSSIFDNAEFKKNSDKDKERVIRALKILNEGLEADLTAYKVTIDGDQISMAPKEYDLLFFLIRNKNIAIPRGKLLEEVWGFDYFGDDRTLDTHIKLLRKSLGPYAKFIVTLRGLGYRFEG